MHSGREREKCQEVEREGKKRDMCRKYRNRLVQMNRCRKERGKVGCRGIGAEKNKNGQLQRRNSCRRKGRSRGIGEGSRDGGGE